MRTRITTRVLSVLGCLCAVLLPRALGAEPVWERHLRVGVSVIPAQLDLLTSDEAVAWIIRRATNRALVRAQLTDDGAITPAADIASAWSSRADLRGWSFRLRTEERFSNGRVISPDDVMVSIRRCSQRSRLPSSLEAVLSRTAHSVEEPISGDPVWLLVRLPQSVEAGERREANDKIFPPFLRALEACEVVPDDLVQSFGELFGHPTIFTGAGPFVVTEYTPDRRVELRLTPDQLQRRTRGPRRIEIMPYGDPAAGIRALQRGELDILFPATGQQVGEGDLDPTLARERCEGRAILKRRSVGVPCLTLLDIGSASVTY